MTPPSILVAGIGNIFMGDDAFGVEVVRRLSQRSIPNGVRVVDYGIRGFDLAYALMDGHDLTILVDAVPWGGQPGTIYTIEPDLDEIEVSSEKQTEIETHGMNPMRVLAMVKAMGGDLKRILLVGCEPATLGPEEGLMGLSPEVQASIDEAVRTIELLIARFQQEILECGVMRVSPGMEAL